MKIPGRRIGRRPPAATSGKHQRAGALVLCVAVGLFFAGAARAQRLEWAPVGEFIDVPAQEPGATDHYQVERWTGAGWEIAAIIAHARSDPHFDAREGRFVWTDPSGGTAYRVRTVSVIGNVSEAFEIPAPARCSWKRGACSAPVLCERDCLCDVVRERLDIAYVQLLETGLVEDHVLDGAICHLGIALVGPERLLQGRAAGAVAGDGAGRRWMLLATDMRAASHELFHLYEEAAGVPATDRQGHKAWQREPRLRELDAKRGLTRPEDHQ